jgi:pimeloyl-ACP methyl ester carboxylesterase
MKHIYCISGFGADERLFSELKFPNHEIHFIKWITPEKNQSIESYAKKLVVQILHPNPILVGLSFGGIMCIEISKLITIDFIIIISSIKNNNELPLWMRLSGKLKLNRLLPMRSYKILAPLQNYNLDVKTKEAKRLVNEYRRNLDIKYSNWAVNAILNWKNEKAPDNLYHIHGDNDRIFSIKRIKADYKISDGGHLMILNKSDELNACIKSILLNKIEC